MTDAAAAAVYTERQVIWFAVWLGLAISCASECTVDNGIPGD